jgi:ferredoxin
MTKVPEQVSCLIKAEGAGKDYISVTDNWPKEARDRIKNSKWNLCAACVAGAAAYSEDAADLILAIENIERQIKDDELARRQETP